METKNDQIVEITNEDVVENDFSTEELEADTTDWKAKALELKGIAKRRATQLAKAKEKLATKTASSPAPQDKIVIENKKSDNSLLEKAYLRSAGITVEDEVELALSTANRWGVDIDKVVDDEDFKVKLERIRINKANLLATTNIKSGGGGSEAKNTPEYWVSKGVPPTPDQVPNRKVRAKIARAMMEDAKSSKMFYND